MDDARKLHDLVIRAGLLVDGSGAEPWIGDLAIHGRRIAAIGPPNSLRGIRTIDATNHMVCPGFVDLHSHADFTIHGHPSAVPALKQGVTTLVVGNCGWSPFPRSRDRLLERTCSFFEPPTVRSYSTATMFADYLDRLRPGVNLVLQAGHSSIRLAVMGHTDRRADFLDIRRMCDAIALAAEQGVHGFSSGLVYAPGSYADTKEMVALATAAAENGLLYSTHLRNEGALLLESVSEAIDTARVSGSKLEISHLKAMGKRNHGAISLALQKVEDACREGVDVACDVYPYTASSTTLMSRLPRWATEGGVGAFIGRVHDRSSRREMVREIDSSFEIDMPPSSIVISSMSPGKWAPFVGQSLDEISVTVGMSPGEVSVGMLRDHEGNVLVTIHSMSEGDMLEVLRHVRSSVVSDGWVMSPSGKGRPHPRNFGSFSRVIANYVRRKGLLALPQAVAKMSSIPAERIGLADRGLLRTGAIADIAVIDYEDYEDRATYQRPWRLASGVRYVLIGGECALVDGKVSEQRFGEVVRR